MSKPWRMVVLAIGSWITLGLLWFGGGQTSVGGMSVLQWSCAIIIVGCIQTIWVRLARIMRTLSGSASP